MQLNATAKGISMNKYEALALTGFFLMMSILGIAGATVGAIRADSEARIYEAQQCAKEQP